ANAPNPQRIRWDVLHKIGKQCGSGFQGLQQTVSFSDAHAPFARTRVSRARNLFWLPGCATELAHAVPGTHSAVFRSATDRRCTGNRTSGTDHQSTAGPPSNSFEFGRANGSG